MTCRGARQSRDPACLRLAKSRLRRLLACMAPAGAHAAQVESLTLRHVAEVRYLNTTFS